MGEAQGEWHWANLGVEVRDGRILWYEDLGPVAFASGAGVEQSYEDFLTKGPQYEDAPDDIVAAVRATVLRLATPG